jgi:hypothetical protein
VTTCAHDAERRPRSSSRHSNLRSRSATGAAIGPGVIGFSGDPPAHRCAAQCRPGSRREPLTANGAPRFVTRRRARDRRRAPRSRAARRTRSPPSAGLVRNPLILRLNRRCFHRAKTLHSGARSRAYSHGHGRGRLVAVADPPCTVLRTPSEKGLSHGSENWLLVNAPRAPSSAARPSLPSRARPWRAPRRSCRCGARGPRRRRRTPPCPRGRRSTRSERSRPPCA